MDVLISSKKFDTRTKSNESYIYQMMIEIGNKAFRKKKEIILIENRERCYKKQGREASRNILRGAGMSKILVGEGLWWA